MALGQPKAQMAPDPAGARSPGGPQRVDAESSATAAVAKPAQTVNSIRTARMVMVGPFITPIPNCVAKRDASRLGRPCPGPTVYAHP